MREAVGQPVEHHPAVLAEADHPGQPQHLQRVGAPDPRWPPGPGPGRPRTVPRPRPARTGSGTGPDRPGIPSNPASRPASPVARHPARAAATRSGLTGCSCSSPDIRTSVHPYALHGYPETSNHPLLFRHPDTNRISFQPSAGYRGYLHPHGGPDIRNLAAVWRITSAVTPASQERPRRPRDHASFSPPSLPPRLSAGHRPLRVGHRSPPSSRRAAPSG